MPNIVDEVKLDFKDVLLRPEWSTLKSRADVDLYRDINFRNSTRKYRGVPLIAANMDTVGTFDMAKALHRHGVLTTVHKYYSVDVWEEFAAVYPEVMENVALSCGTGEEDYKKFQQILATVPEINTLCLDLDVANGYSQSFVDFVRKVREAYPYHTIIAGNVVTGKMVEELVLSGADIIKVGIGPGSVCTTPFKAGVGYPQLSAVMECADAAHDLGAHIISDGGCTCPGDVAKAFAGGADFVMLGGMLAGHDQSGGELKVKSDGTKVRLFYGVSSSTAMRKYAESMSCASCQRKMPQFHANFSVLAAEGKTVEVPYRGDVSDTIIDILGELRSTCTSTGAANLKELTRRATFIRCTQQYNQVFAQLSTKD